MVIRASGSSFDIRTIPGVVLDNRFGSQLTGSNILENGRGKERTFDNTRRSTPSRTRCTSPSGSIFMISVSVDGGTSATGCCDILYDRRTMLRMFKRVLGKGLDCGERLMCFEGAKRAHERTWSLYQ